jgi:2-polyprenyl-3-methyl-5-hydroxy-6-metoxy-1,4-benzoquinol methylase
MFGKKIDYYLLKPFTHSENRATEDELMALARESSYSLDGARAYCERVKHEYFDGTLPIDKSLSYLDIGSGIGRLSIGLSLCGATDVTGVEVVERHVAEAKGIAANLEEDLRPQFHCVDIHSWDSGRQYDVVIVLGAMEHIRDPENFLELLPRFMKPDGAAFVSFEPFKSPLGDHMRGFFRIQIPWRGLLFSEEAVLRLRRECFRPTDPARRYQEIVGGLNLMTFSEYLRYVRDAGLEFVAHNFNPQIKRHWLLRAIYPINWILTHIPKVQDYFIICGYSILKKRLV